MGSIRKLFSHLKALVASFLVRFLLDNASGDLSRFIVSTSLGSHRVYGDPSRLRIHPTAIVNDALFNVVSGTIEIGEKTFFGHGVSLITGTHNANAIGEERRSHPSEGRDIVIGKGVWICSNVVILGPCVIGDNAVIGALSLVKNNVPAGTVVAGVPASHIKAVQGHDS